jgi:hypothetical protein
MRRFLLLTAALLTVAALAAGAQVAPKDDKAKKDGKAADATDPLAPGKDLPGPFHPFNVTGPYADHFHCPVSDHNLDPGVLVFSRDLVLSPPLRKLLSGLDAAIDKNPAVRLAAAATFLSDDLPNVVEDDDKRDELKGRVQAMAKDLGLKHVVLSLDSRADLEKYLRGENVVVTVVLYKKFQIVASHPLQRDEFTDAKVQEILGEVASKLGATKK